MYEAERKQHILKLLKEQGWVDVQGLNQLLGVSESTIRRDLNELEESRLLKRTHGGAVPVTPVNHEPTFEAKSGSGKEVKRALAVRAAEEIREGDVIILDSGTTMLYLAIELKRFNRLTVITNSLPIAQELHSNEGIELIVLGGSMRKGILSFVGPLAEQNISQFYVDKAFIATNGIHPEGGLTTPNMDEATIKRMMIQSSARAILVADSSKIGVMNLVKFAPAEAVHTFITDSGASEEAILRFESKGVDMCIVPAGEAAGSIDPQHTN